MMTLPQNYSNSISGQISQWNGTAESIKLWHTPNLSTHTHSYTTSPVLNMNNSFPNYNHVNHYHHHHPVGMTARTLTSPHTNNHNNHNQPPQPNHNPTTTSSLSNPSITFTIALPIPISSKMSYFHIISPSLNAPSHPSLMVTSPSNANSSTPFSVLQLKTKWANMKRQGYSIIITISTKPKIKIIQLIGNSLQNGPQLTQSQSQSIASLTNSRPVPK